MTKRANSKDMNAANKTFEYKQLTTIRAHSKYKYAAKKLLNKDLRRDSDFKEKFERANREAAHLRAGGQSRISHLKESVKEKDSKLVDLVAALGYVWMLRVYIHLVGDPKKTRAEVVTRMINGKKSVGVITKDAPDPLPRGVFKVRVRHRSRVSCAKKICRKYLVGQIFGAWHIEHCIAGRFEGERSDKLR